MKKTIYILTSLILLCVMLVGCGSTDAKIDTSKELHKNLNLLSSTVSRLDTVDNEYLVNNELYSLNTISNTTPSQNKVEKFALANSYNVIIEDDETNSVRKIAIRDDLTSALKDEIINRLYCDENGNCKLCDEKFICDDNNICGSCNKTIICDENGNCTRCNEKLIVNNNSCSSCNNTCTTSTPNSLMSENTKNCLQKISSDNQELEIELLSIKNNTKDIKENPNKITTLEETENNQVSDNTPTLQDNIILDYDNNNSNTDSNLENENNTDNSIISENDSNQPLEEPTTFEDKSAPKYNFYYYSEEMFTPDFLRYKPRFISNINYENANSNIERYVDKLQKLYTMTADVVEANNTLSNYKITVLNNIDDTRELNNCILSGTCTPTISQVQALENYIADIKTTISNLRNCNGNLVNEINKISTANTGLNQSIDVTNSNYLRILNQIDTRISYHENALATLEQIKYILEDAKSNTIEDLEIEDLNNNQVTNSDTKTNIDTMTPIIEDNTNTPSFVVDNNSNNIDNQIINPNDSDLDNTNNINIDSNTNEPIDNYTENTDTSDTTVNTDTTVSTNNSEVNNNTNIDTNSNTTTEDSNLNNNESNNEDNNDYEERIENTTNTTTAIDTNNSDTTNENTENNNIEITPLPEEELNKTNSILESNESIDNNTTETNIGLIDTYGDNNIKNIDTMLNSNDVDNTDSDINTIVNSEPTRETPTMLDNNYITNLNNNNVGTNFNTSNINPNNVGNTNINGNYANSIINETNLGNEGITNQSYSYSQDGHLYNNIHNNAINNTNKNSNVNTYKYNTLVDSINRGTVNNGINTL